MNILIVEDDDDIAAAVEQTLSAHGFETQRVGSGAESLSRLSGTDLVLLDLGLPDLDGNEVCRRIRESSCVPIVVLSGRSEELDRVMALHMGADDFVAKPFSRHELVARIQVLLRRAEGCAHQTPDDDPAGTIEARTAPDRAHIPRQGAHVPNHHAGSHADGAVRTVDVAPAPPEEHRSTLRAAPLLAGPIRLDPRTRKVFVHDREVRITRKEFDLLAMLLEEPGTVRERQNIMSRVWDENWFGSTRTLDVHVGSLRSKLGHTEWIETVRGVGYRLTVPTATHN